jgi:hypothetical protein
MAYPASSVSLPSERYPAGASQRAGRARRVAEAVPARVSRVLVGALAAEGVHDGALLGGAGHGVPRVALRRGEALQVVGRQRRQRRLVLRGLPLPPPLPRWQAWRLRRSSDGYFMVLFEVRYTICTRIATYRHTQLNILK